MGAGVKLSNASPGSRPIPTTGMRGGLGRTLLTAFLLLTILPLALVGWYAVRQNRANLQQELANKLQAVATSKAQELQLWLADRQMLIFALAEDECVAHAASALTPESLEHRVPGLLGATLFDSAAHPIWSVGVCEVDVPPLMGSAANPQDAVFVWQTPYGAETAILCFQLSELKNLVQTHLALGQTGQIYLVKDGYLWPEGGMLGGPAVMLVVSEQPGSHVYTNHAGVDVAGAYAPLPGLGLGVLVEQEQAEILKSDERIVATFIGVILAVVLATTMISAVVIRQITRPVIRLTESALDMAEGNLEQFVPVTSRDEIGILTHVFNTMAAELKSLYDDLEAKVVERTQKLQRANYQIQRRALQLAASLEVSQAITSVRDPDVLLSQVAHLICDRFIYASVAVYLVEPGGGQACLKAMSPPGAEWPQDIRAGDGTVMERALRKGLPQTQVRELVEDYAWSQRTLTQIAIPLRMELRVLGVVGVLSAEREGVHESDLRVLEHLANQIAIALENARAYERERQATRQLEEAEEFKARFLANMSHHLREPLNSILGFSRLMLKGLDGPLSDEQRQDIRRIYNNSQQLLAMINDILAISQIQAGLMDLQIRPVNIQEIVDSVLPTAGALVRGKDVELAVTVPVDLPPVGGDPARLRQVLLRLLTNAAKFTERGQITVKAWADEEQCYVSVTDTGLGIPQEDRERIFMGFDKGVGDGRPQGPGLGLALSKEYIEMHHGRIWLESVVGRGSTFTFSVPLYTPAAPGTAPPPAVEFEDETPVVIVED